MESSIFSTSHKSGDDICDLLDQIRALQAVDNTSKDKPSSDEEITNIEDPDLHLPNDGDINPWGDVVDDFFEAPSDKNETQLLHLPAIEQIEEHIVTTDVDNNLSDKSTKITENQIPDNPPFICYLHGLPVDVGIMDIGMVFMGLKVTFTEIKIPTEENVIGSIVFKERSGLVTAIEHQSIEINDVKVILSLSKDTSNIADSTKTTLVDEHEKTIIESQVIEAKSKVDESIELIQPIQDFIEPSSISLYPPYSLYLFNLPKNTSKNEITKLFEPHNLADILLPQNTDSTFNGCIEFKSRTDLIGVIELSSNYCYKIRGHRIILSFNKDYAMKYEKSKLSQSSDTLSLSSKDLQSDIQTSITEQNDDMIKTIDIDQPIEANDINSVSSLSLPTNFTNDSSSSTNSTKIIIPDTNITNKVDDEKTNEILSSELIQPIQHVINELTVSLYPPYSCYLFNLPNDTSEQEISQLFETYNFASIVLRKKSESIIGNIELKSRSDLISMIRNSLNDDEKNMFKIRNQRVILSLSQDYTINFGTSNKLPQISSSSTLVSPQQNLNLQKKTIPTPAVPVIANVNETIVALPINEQQIPFNSPFLLYLFNISPDIAEKNAQEMIGDTFKAINLDVTNVQKCLTNSYSVEFSKRSDLVVAVRKNNFVIEGKEIIISISPKLIRSQPQSTTNDTDKNRLLQNENIRKQPPLMQQNHQVVQHQNRQPSHEQNRQSFHQTNNQQQRRPFFSLPPQPVMQIQPQPLMQIPLQPLMQIPPQQLMQIPQIHPDYLSFKGTILVPNSPQFSNWIKILNFPRNATDKDLVNLLQKYKISVTRIIITNVGICFCQFPTLNEFEKLFTIMLTTPILFNGVYIVIINVNADDSRQIANILATMQNDQRLNQPSIQNSSKTKQQLSKPAEQLKSNTVQPKVNDNNQTNALPTSSDKGAISLADQLAKLSGKTSDNKKPNSLTEQPIITTKNSNPFRGSAESNKKQDIDANVKITNTTDITRDITSNNNNNNRGRTNRNNDRSSRRESNNNNNNNGGRTNNKNMERSISSESNNNNRGGANRNKNRSTRRDSSQQSTRSHMSTTSQYYRRRRPQNSNNHNNPNPWSNKLIPKLQYECIKCKKISILTCSNCGMFYCSIACQQNDWPAHKNNCKIPELISSTEYHEKLLKQMNMKEKQISLPSAENNVSNISKIQTNQLVTKDITLIELNKSKICQQKLKEFPKEIINLPNILVTEEKKQNKVVEKVIPEVLQKTIETPMVRGQINVPYCDVPKPGASVLISAVLDGITVFIRSGDPEHDTEYKYNLSIIAEYAKSSSKSLVENPVLGQVILAPLNDNLQRALVLKQKENLLAVAFIDFGNIGMVKFDECCDLSGNLQMLKRYVHKCTIDLNPKYRTNDMSKKLIESFKDFKLDLLYKMPFNNSTLVDLTNPLNGISLKKSIEKID